MIANKNHSLHPQQRNLALIFERDVDEDLNKKCLHELFTNHNTCKIPSLWWRQRSSCGIRAKYEDDTSTQAADMVKLDKRWHAVLTQYFQPATGTLSAGHW